MHHCSMPYKISLPCFLPSELSVTCSRPGQAGGVHGSSSCMAILFLTNIVTVTNGDFFAAISSKANGSSHLVCDGALVTSLSHE